MLHRRVQTRPDYLSSELAWRLVRNPDGSGEYRAEPSGRSFGLGPLVANGAAPQAYKDVSSDRRTGLSSFFGYGKRSAERNAYQQAHMTPSGVPGVLNLAVVAPNGTPIPYAPFNWNGRQMYTDAKGQIKYVEKDYFQTAISLENERVKYVTQMISLVAGQPSENVIALFGWDFYDALGGDREEDRGEGIQSRKAYALYNSYLYQAGLPQDVIDRKLQLFKRYADAECSPEVMCNYGDNDPQWSRAFNKLSLLIEYHPSAILFDSGSLNPTESSGMIHGDAGRHNAGPMDEYAIKNKAIIAATPTNVVYPGSTQMGEVAGDMPYPQTATRPGPVPAPPQPGPAPMQG